MPSASRGPTLPDTGQFGGPHHERPDEGNTGGDRKMPWTRLDPAQVARHLRADHDPALQAGEALAEQALGHVRAALLSGEYVAVQDEAGHTFIGTEAEAVEHMLDRAGA